MTKVKQAPVALLLAFLYVAQGIPFGFATEYLPVVLRTEGYSNAAIAAIGWLQLPWQLKILWAKAADHRRLRSHGRKLLFSLQLLLTLVVAAFAIRPFASAPMLWFVLTALAATVAATQDVFVDALAVRVLTADERGTGNIAQVGGYRVGILLGGAALLVLVGHIGERTTLLACAGIVAAASVGAFVSSEGRGGPAAETIPKSIRGLLTHMLEPRARDVLVAALTFKLGLHMAGALLKPMAVDYHWSRAQIGWVVVVCGTSGALVGSGLGGILHRRIGEATALRLSLVAQALVCLPLVAVDRLHAPLVLTAAAIGLENFVSGLGTTVLFAALMTATRPADAGLHFTILTSANALAIGIGSVIGGTLADKLGRSPTFVIAALVCLAPGIFLRRWDAAASASAA